MGQAQTENLMANMYTSESYPKIGSKQSYVRLCTKSKSAMTGEGHVKNIFLDPDKRLNVQLEVMVADEPHVYNIDVNCLNPTADFIMLFEAAIKKVDELTIEGNEKVQAVVKDYEQLIKDTYSGILGNPVEFEEV